MKLNNHTIAEDIQRLRSLTIAPPLGLLSSDEEALLRVCDALEKCTDALEASLKDVEEARAAQAHTALCNLELMRKLDQLKAVSGEE